MSIVSNNSSSKIATLKTDEQGESDLIIGDKVFCISDPSKSGRVAYFGTTSFSDGDWIGVSLDKPLGKNNGTVQGKFYFKCDHNHGIFVRRNNLKRIKDLSKTSNKIESQINNNSVLRDSMKDDNKFVAPISLSNFNLGDRVAVPERNSNSFFKIGTLRFLGKTKFSDGSWAGIELDDPIGKNDGCVEGVRYFSCKSRYGLFAQESKVQKYDVSKHFKQTGKINFSRQGSLESVSSVASNFSSASRTRYRPNQISTPHTKTTNDRTITMPSKSRSNKPFDTELENLQKVLKEKEQHIEQLMREREHEKMNLGDTNVRYDELESQLNQTIATLNEERVQFQLKLSEQSSGSIVALQQLELMKEKYEEEHKKVEDLMFQMEEKNIDERDFENKTEESENQIFELNEKLSYEREQRELLEKKLDQLQKSQQDATSNGVSDIEYNSIAIDEKNAIIKQLEVDLAKEKQNSKGASVLQTLEEKTAMYNDLLDRFNDLKKKLEKSNSMLQYFSEENSQMKSVVEDQDLVKLNLSNDNDMLCQQNTSQQHKIEELTKQLERVNNDLNELRMSGNKNQAEKIMKMEEQLHQKEMDYQERESKLKSNLNNLTIELDKIHRKTGSNEDNMAALQSILESTKQQLKQKESELEELSMMMDQYHADNNSLNNNQQHLVDERDKLLQELTICNQQLTKLRQQITEWHSERQQLLDFKTQAERNERNFIAEIDEMKSRVEFSDKENAVLKENLQELKEESHTVERVKKIQLQLLQLDENLKKERDENLILITKNATLYSELEDAKHNREEQHAELFENCRQLEQIRQNCIEEIDLLKTKLKEKSDELSMIRERLLKVSQEQETVQDSYCSLRDKYDREKKLNAEKFRKLERQLEESEKKSLNDSMSDNKRKSDSREPQSPTVSALKNAKENAEAQINFLNSVIADQQKKLQTLNDQNNELRQELQTLQARIDQSESASPDKSKRRKEVAPRLYCDECEEFDAHDTADCPQLESQRRELAQHYVVNGSTSRTDQSTRVYCEICEVFDTHNTAQCPFDETF